MSCSFKECPEPAKRDGLCSAHYRQQVRGMPLQPLQRLRGIDAKLAAYTKADGDCLVWTGAKSGGGYGRITINGERFRAHRIAYEHKHGFVAEHLDVHHTCGNKLCVNPNHLKLLDHAVHMRHHNQR